MRTTLNEFAKRCGISDRHARRLLADNEVELVGHFERRGGRATLIDEVAAEFLQNLLRNPVSVLPEETPAITEREAKLLLQLADAERRAADAERRAGENAFAAARLESAEQRQHQLEEHARSQEAQICDLSAELGAEREKTAQAEKTAQKAADELTEAKKEIERMKNATFWQRLRGFKE